MSEMKPIMINVKLEDLIEMKKNVKEAMSPSIAYTGNMKEMKKKADERIQQLLYLINGTLSKWVR